MVINVDWGNVSDSAVNEMVEEILNPEGEYSAVDWVNNWTKTLDMCKTYSINLEFRTGVSVYPIAFHGPTPSLGVYHIDENLLRAGCIVLIKIMNG